MGKTQVSVCSKGGLPYTVSGCVPKRCTAPDEKTSHAYQAVVKTMESHCPTAVSTENMGGLWPLIWLDLVALHD